ncbi:unnamed protein product [Cuscuta epithymum]|uniref:Protein kinase domain-containing protein n=1 Tax=Cuscuta epithymum TaxID=186058 RepID=A0AAV0BXV1_9ASTE|nr:unnamed protein product [Cuscuta epithymum]
MSFAIRTLVFFICVFLITTPVTISVSDEEVLLRVKKSLKNAAALASWKAGTDPCDMKNQWAGVVCSNNIVTGLRLGGMGLSGEIDVQALSQIPGLRTLSLIQNSFSGPIPEFNQIGALKALYISRNQFSGDIPSDFFTKMGSMKKVWLSDNKFTGPIPSSLAGLPRILEIHLENNRFSGEIPEFKQKTLVSVDFSNNNLQGEIPAGLSSRFNSSSFKGNPGLCSIQVLGKPCQEMVSSGQMVGKSRNNKISSAPAATNDGRSSNNISSPGKETTAVAPDVDEGKAKNVSIGMMAASGIILALMLTGIAILKRRQEKLEMMMIPEDPSVMSGGELSGRRSGSSVRIISGSGRRGGRGGDGELVMVNDEKGVFGLPDLMTAAAEVMGDGTMGSSYKATMTNGTAVVVRRVKEMNGVGLEDFDLELRRLGGLRHKNILTPLAYYYRKEEKLLVYEFMPKGSLLYVLHGDRGTTHSELNWQTRLNIVSGIAQGLGFLHEELHPYQVPHGDLQSSNILLTQDYEPRLSNYGYVSLINTANAAESLMAFRSPEALQFNQVSPKSDVYCLGIVILEVVTGKFPSEYLNNGNGGTDVVQWVKSAIADGREDEVLDPEIAVDSRCSTEQMRRLLRVGEACAESNPDRRLDLREAIRRIEEIVHAADGGEGPDQRSTYDMPSLRDGYAHQVEEGRGVAAVSDDGKSLH